jgi:sortase A
LLSGVAAYTGATMATTTDGSPGPDASGFEAVALPGGDGYPPPPPPRYQQPAHAAWKPPLGPVRRTIREIGFDLITAGVLVLLFVAYQLWGTGFAEAKSQSKLKTQFTTAAPAAGADNPALGATQTAVAGPPEGSAIAHIVIPTIGVDKYVVEGVTESALQAGPGHYPGTPMPGEPGNVAIAGHRTTYGAPFFRLNELKPGDKIQMATKTKQFLYVVDHTEIVKPTDVAVIGPTSDNRLTLTTCNPRYEATNRLIVVAELTDEPVIPPPTVAPPVVKTAVSLGTGDHSAWPSTLLYGGFFVILWIGIRLWAARRRYWKWIPFLAGIPVCLFPLWFFFENAFRLLPNNI